MQAPRRFVKIHNAFIDCAKKLCYIYNDKMRFDAERMVLMNHYDVIVVGAGNGGLAAGATLAKEGYRTLVLEKHNLPGGCATSFVRGRFEFEAALHELCAESTSDGDSVVKIFDRLGVDVPLLHENTLFRTICKGEDGFDVRLRAGYDNFLDDMEAAVPGCRESVKKFIDLNVLLDEAQDYLDKGAVNPTVLFGKYGDFVRAASHSADEVMEACGIPKKAQQILSTYWGYLGVPTDDLNGLHYLSLFCAYMEKIPSMPYHRSHELSLGMVKALQSFGGEIRYNTEVTRFLFDKGKCIGVMAGSEVFYAKKVISNVIPNNVFNRMSPAEVGKRDRKLANARKLGMTFMTVYLGLDASMEDLGIEDYSVFIQNDPDNRKQFENRLDFGMYVVNCLNKVLPDSSPAGTCTLFFTLPFMPGDLPKDLTARTYKEFKNAHAEKYIRDYEKVMGVNVMDHIEEIAIASPVTFARYLSTPDGCIYGYANETWDNVVTRTVTEALDYRVPNLYFCGGHGKRGDGYPSGYMTGYWAALAVIKALKEGK